MYLRNVVAGIRKKVIPDPEDETPKHRQRQQQRSCFLLSRDEESCGYQRPERDDDRDVYVTERGELYDRRLMRQTMKCGNDEMDQNQCGCSERACLGCCCFSHGSR